MTRRSAQTERWRACRQVALSALLAAALGLATAAHAQISVVGVSTTPPPSSSSVGSVTINTVPGTVANDVLIALVAIRGGSGVSIGSVPAGWTLVNRTNTGTAIAQAVYARVATATEPASHTWSFSPSDRAAVAMIALRGVDPANPVDASAGQATAGPASAIVAPSVAPATANTLLLALFSADDGSGSWVPPSGMTERADLGTGAGPNGTTISIHSEPRSAAGATGTRTATYSSAQAGAGARVAPRARSFSITGTVFEDVNYGGGAGRALAAALAAGGSRRPQARVELYGAKDTFVTAATTNALGQYQFAGLLPGTYTVRVVNGSVTSSRSAAAGSSARVPVQTFRAGADGTNRVGGENPGRVDAGNGSTTLGALNTGTTTAQSVVQVAISAADATEVDFGFNFNTVVNTRDTGQGSLRQVISNLAALGGDAGLAITDLSGRSLAGQDPTIFMIPDGSATPGMNPAFDFFTTKGCGAKVATIRPASALPPVSGLRLDAQTHPAFVATLSADPGNPGRPVIEIDGSLAPAGTVGIVAAGTAAAAGLIINRFPSHGISASGTAVRLEGSWVGLDCSGNAAAPNGGDGIRYPTGGSHVLGMHTGFAARYRMVVSGNAGDGVSAAANLTVQGSYVGTSAAGTAAVPNGGDGIDFTSSNLSLNGAGGGGGWPNVVSGNAGWGVRIGSVHGLAASISGNVIGRSADRSAAIANGAGGILIGTTFDSGGATCYPVTGNTIASNGGPGVRVDGGSPKACVQLRANSIYGNAGLGIDLAPGGVTGPTPNDGLKGAAGSPNLLMDTPVFTEARLVGTNLTVRGYVGSAAGQSLFGGSRVEVYAAETVGAGAAQGRTLLGVVMAASDGTFDATLDVSGQGVGSGTRVVGTAEDGAGHTSEFSADPASVVVVPPVGSFNAFEPATPAGAITGVIQTRQAGFAFTLAIVAIAGGAVQTSFTGNVTVELLDARDASGALDPATGCRASWVAIAGTAQTVTFTGADQGRRQATFSHGEAWRDVRVRMTHAPAAGAPVVACSSDNFAIRPAAFLVTATDGDRRSPGTSRVLDNAALGGVVHHAGRPFTLTVRAVNANGAVTANYTLAPQASVAPCAGVACPPSVGTLAFSGSAVAGVLVANDAAYTEVGAFALTMTDTAFAAVDAADTPATARTIASTAPLTVGRFVPDRFAVTLNAPQFAAGCVPGAFTYVGQPFGFAAGAQPVATVRALNAAGALTVNYTGPLWRVSNATLANRSYAAAVGTLDTSGLPPASADPAVVDAGAGTGTLTFSSGAGLAFARGAPVAPFNADIALAIDLIDADGVLYADDSGLSLNPVRFGAASPGAGIAFSGGRQVLFGRLRVPNANGPEILALPLRISAEHWTGTAFITNFNDRCTTLAPTHVVLSNWQRNLNPGETAPGNLGTLTAGFRLMRMAAPGPGNDGSVDVTLDLGPAGANLPWLRGAWSGGPAWIENPTGRATFGAASGAPAILFRRENF